LLDDGALEYLSESLLKSSLAEYVARRVLVRLGIMPEEAPLQVVRTLISKYVSHDVVKKEVLNEILTRYVDLDVLKSFFSDVKLGRLTKKVMIVNELSPIALEGLKVAGGYGRVEVEKLPKNVVVELLKKRLLEKEVKLYCLNCGESWRDVIKNLPERVSCGRCGYSVVGVYFGNEDLSNLVRRVIKYGARYEFLVSEEEKRKYDELVASARLVLTYGKKAIIALAARGVGPHNAVKALSSSSEEEFYLSLYELEKNYVRTRKYWRD
jgi:ATP-dependent Lhr-like helicase